MKNNFPTLRQGEARDRIVYAVMADDLAAVMQWRSENQSIDINAPIDNTGRTLLMWAAATSANKSARYLIEQGADSSTRDGREMNALHYAAIGGNAAFLELLVPFRDDYLHGSTDVDQRTPLWHAVSAGHKNVVTAMEKLPIVLSKKTLLDVESALNQTGFPMDNSTEISQAIASMMVRVDFSYRLSTMSYEELEAFVAHYNMTDFNYHYLDFKISPLYRASISAAEEGDTRKVEFLLSKGAGPNFGLPHYQNFILPLAFSMLHARHDKVVDILMRAGLDIHSPVWSGQTIEGYANRPDDNVETRALLNKNLKRMQEIDFDLQMQRWHDAINKPRAVTLPRMKR